MTYPFRFYGCQPIEWSEGANAGHRYEVTFREAPTDEAKAALARTWEGVVATGPVEGATRPWRWHDRSAAFFVGEREREAFFEGARAMLEALHAVWPLEEAVFRGAWWEEGFGPWGRDPWDAWSVRQCADPIRAFSTAVPGDVDAGFERARRVAVLGEEAVAASEALEAERLARAELALMPPTEKPPTFALPAKAHKQLGVPYAHQVIGSVSGRVYTKPSRRDEAIAWFGDDGSVMRWGESAVEVGPVTSFDGRWMAVAIAGPPRPPESAPSVSSPHARAGHQVVVIDLRDGSSRAVWRTSPEDCYVRGLWIGASRLVVLTKSLRLFQRTEGDAIQLDERVEGRDRSALFFGLHGDRVLVDLERHGGVRVYRIDRDKLEPFGAVSHQPHRFKHWPLPACDGTRIVGVTEPSETPIELVNVEARWRATFDEPL